MMTVFAELMTIVSSHPFDDVGEEFIQTNQNQIFNRLKMCEANLDRNAHLIITITIVTIITICFIITIFSTIVITIVIATPAYLDRTVHVVHKCNWGKKDGQLHLFYLSRSAKSCKLQKKNAKNICGINCQNAILKQYFVCPGWVHRVHCQVGGCTHRMANIVDLSIFNDLRSCEENL